MSKREQPLYWPAKMVEHIQLEAARLDRSMSWCVQFAWTHARAEILALEKQQEHAVAEAVYDARFACEDKRKQTLFFSEEMLKEIQDEATRQDRSLSWMVQRAWCMSVDAIAALPAVADVTTSGDSN